MKRAVHLCLARTIALWDLAAGRRQKDGPMVLVYHDVPNSSSAGFARQIDWIKANVVALQPERIFSPVEQHPRPSVVVTFDDALDGVFRNAIPLLAAVGIPALIFVPTACLGAAPGWKRRSNVIDRRTIVASRETLVRSLSPSVHYGSHGRTHLSMFDASESQARDEIFGSKAELEDLVGRSVDHFAFPYGHFSQRHVSLCREAGYRSACAANPQIKVRNGLGIRVVPRVPVTPEDTLPELGLKIRGAYRWQGLLGLARERASFHAPALVKSL